MRPSATYVGQIISTPLKVAEVGVGAGNNAIDMLGNLDISQLYLIDPYVAYNDNGTPVEESGYTETQESQDMYCALMTENIQPFLDKVTIVKSLSVEAAATYSDGFFDYVYLDACLCEQSVYEDITAWFPKVISGGVLGGHDYDSYPGVKPSVDRFVSENGLSLQLSTGPEGTDWFILKG